MAVDPKLLHQLEVVVRGPGNMSVLNALIGMGIMPQTPDEDERMVRNMRTVSIFIRDRVTGDLQSAAADVFHEFGEQIQKHIEARAKGQGNPPRRGDKR